MFRAAVHLYCLGLGILAVIANDSIYFDEPAASEVVSQQVQPGQSAYYLMADAGPYVEPTQELKRIIRALQQSTDLADYAENDLFVPEETQRSISVLEMLDTLLKGSQTQPDQLNRTPVNRRSIDAVEDALTNAEDYVAAELETLADRRQALRKILRQQRQIQLPSVTVNQRQITPNVTHLRQLIADLPRPHLPQLRFKIGGGGGGGSGSGSAQPTNAKNTAQLSIGINAQKPSDAIAGTLHTLHNILPFRHGPEPQTTHAPRPQRPTLRPFLTRLFGHAQPTCAPCVCATAATSAPLSAEDASETETTTLSAIVETTTTAKPPTTPAPTVPTQTAVAITSTKDKPVHGDFADLLGDDYNDLPAATHSKAKPLRQHPVVYFNINAAGPNAHLPNHHPLHSVVNVPNFSYPQLYQNPTAISPTYPQAPNPFALPLFTPSELPHNTIPNKNIFSPQNRELYEHLFQPNSWDGPALGQPSPYLPPPCIPVANYPQQQRSLLDYLQYPALIRH